MTEPMPTLEEIVAKIESVKVAKGLTWNDLASKVGQAPVWVAAALTGQCSMSAEDLCGCCRGLGAYGGRVQDSSRLSVSWKLADFYSFRPIRVSIL